VPKKFWLLFNADTVFLFSVQAQRVEIRGKINHKIVWGNHLFFIIAAIAMIFNKKR
jgi:hypothetical protein